SRTKVLKIWRDVRTGSITDFTQGFLCFGCFGVLIAESRAYFEGLLEFLFTAFYHYGPSLYQGGLIAGKGDTAQLLVETESPHSTDVFASPFLCLGHTLSLLEDSVFQFAD